MYSYRFASLELLLKQPCQEIEFGLINSYVHLGLQRAQAMSEAIETKRAHLRIVDTLIHVMCDNLISVSRRGYCFRMIQRLKPILFEMLDTNQYQKKVNQIESLHRYFLPENVKNERSSANKSQNIPINFQQRK
ncbi:hypothetical protein [Aliiglaciecola lipolytica]|uniref:Uncharacterized protein n=1 Tax=Aliiglaciecola lipolytica E3 TaxID=1127673 RepID=K6Y7E8_9ALTE|nr:hypothetical protein [Aliiglaciecola lipolytica]GAC14147.1 hypothetical protein GLIP_1513 [Aliiglaciecola lipolytica E3]